MPSKTIQVGKMGPEGESSTVSTGFGAREKIRSSPFQLSELWRVSYSCELPSPPLLKEGNTTDIDGLKNQR